MRWHRFVDRAFDLIRIAVGISFAVLMVAVIIQVLGRSVFASSPPWTEELTRFALLFLVAFGAGLSFRSGDLVNVDVFSEALPGRWPWIFRLIAAGATVGLCLMIIGPAWTYMEIGAFQTSPALGWRMDFIHGSIVVLIIVLLAAAATRAIGMILGRDDGRPRRDDEAAQ